MHIEGISCRQAGMRGDDCALVGQLAEGIIRRWEADDQGDQLWKARENVDKNAAGTCGLPTLGDTGEAAGDREKHQSGSG